VEESDGHGWNSPPTVKKRRRSAQQSLVFDFHTSILDDTKPGILGTSGGLVVLDTELEPDGLYVTPCFVACEDVVDDLRNLLARTEDVHEVDVSLDLTERVVGSFAENLVGEGVDGNDFVPSSL
jgi:hypothetical protein